MDAGAVEAVVAHDAQPGAPDHTVQALVHKAFTPGLVARMLERVQGVTDELLDGAAGAKRVDLIRDFAMPLPTTIIAEILGVPVRDRYKFHRWSNALVVSSASSWGPLAMFPSVWAFPRYIRHLVKSREAEPRRPGHALVQALRRGTG